MSLLTGALGGAQATRAERLRQLLGYVVGNGRPDLEEIPTAPGPGSSRRLLRLLGAPTARGEAERAAFGAVDSLLTRSFKTLGRHLHAATWAFWPDGTVARHSTPKLIEALRNRPGRSAPVTPESARVYSPSELRTVLARGVPELVERALEARGTLAVTLMLRGRGSTGCTALVLTSPGEDGVFRASSLLLPGLDEAHRKSASPRGDDEDALRIADRVVRHFILGHDRHLRSLRNDFLDQLYVGDRLEPAERIAQIAGQGPNRIEHAETVFLGSERVSFEDLERGPPGAREVLRRGAKEVFGKKLERLELRVVSTRLTHIDPKTLARGTEEREVFTVLVGVRPRRDEETLVFRVGAIMM